MSYCIRVFISCIEPCYIQRVSFNGPIILFNFKMFFSRFFDMEYSFKKFVHITLPTFKMEITKRFAC